MPNELIFIITVLIYLGSVLLLYKLFGKNGLYAFAIFGTLLGNIAVCKCVDIFGLSTTAGNVLYAATFLVTDILSEKYGRKEAGKRNHCRDAANRDRSGCVGFGRGRRRSVQCGKRDFRGWKRSSRAGSGS